MRIPRNFIPVLLAFLLLFAQQAGLAHAVSHLADANRGTSTNKQLPLDPVCDDCLSFAQVGTALTSAAVSFAVHAFHSSLLIQDLVRPAAATTVYRFHSRAPPQFF